MCSIWSSVAGTNDADEDARVQTSHCVADTSRHHHYWSQAGLRLRWACGWKQLRILEGQSEAYLISGKRKCSRLTFPVLNM